MKKTDFIKKIKALISKYDKAFVGAIIDLLEYSYEVENGEEYFYAEFNYQIDDRVHRDDNKIIVKNIEKEFNGEYGVDLRCADTFPNGYSSYILTIDK